MNSYAYLTCSARQMRRVISASVVVLILSFLATTSVFSKTRRFQSHVDYPTDADVVYLVAGDFNHDGKTDLIASTGPVLLGNGDGTFRAGVDFDSTAGGSAITAGDYDGDGKLDLMTTGGVFTSETTLLLGNGDGTFRKAPPFQVGGTPLGIVTGDFNGDQLPDVITANYVSRNISVLLNTGVGH